MSSENPSVPFGFCHCGCGRKTQVSPRNSKHHGYVKGEPRRFVRGHGSRRHESERHRVEDRGYETPCWIWQLAVDHQGYGYDHDEKYAGHRAHRKSWERANGPVPDGLVLDHLCRVPSCVNPAHLEPVTPGENRRRGNYVKLSPDAAAHIREALAAGAKQCDLAAEFGVSPSAISAVAVGKNWRT